MAFEPHLWATHDSPVKDTTERLILIALADKADADGCNTFPSKKTIAKVALCDEKTVQRKLGDLRKRKLIDYGDQEAARYIEKRYRPKVYDMLIPYSWYGPERITRVNAERAGKGLPPLTPENRPPIADAPERTVRSDKGKPRPKKATAGKAKQGGQTVPPRSGAGGTDNPPSGGTESPGSEGTESPKQGVLTDPQTVPADPALDDSAQSSVPSVPTKQVRKANGTDRKGTPGLSLLLAFGSTEPLYLLMGEPLDENAARVDELLGRGWSPAQVRGVLGANLPTKEELRTSPASVLAYRLRKLLEAPVPGSYSSQVPEPREGDEAPALRDTAGAEYSVNEATSDRWRRRFAECEGKQGGCGQLVVPGHTLCRDCIGWPRCANGCGRVVDPDSGRQECESCAGVLELSGAASGPPPF
ncbi:helix-turn-helix domain-containing protein [Streptomyces sp. NPDC005395]|uniref:helix-turn-helix domain-containing protein n=1 Tax=Streptomyces sp. NPDC005395 TaxID=3157042 RepID=UPI0033A601D7